MPIIDITEPERRRIIPSTIKALREWLEKAERGELSGVAIVGTNWNGETLNCWTECENRMTLVGGMEKLKSRILEG